MSGMETSAVETASASISLVCVCVCHCGCWVLRLQLRSRQSIATIFRTMGVRRALTPLSSPPLWLSSLVGRHAANAGRQCLVPCLDPSLHLSKVVWYCQEVVWYLSSEFLTVLSQLVRIKGTSLTTLWL